MYNVVKKIGVYYAEFAYPNGATGIVISSHAEEVEAAAAAKRLNEALAAEKAASILLKYSGKSGAHEMAPVTEFPNVFATPSWGAIAGWKAGERPTVYLPNEVAMSRHMVGKYSLAEVFVFHNAEYATNGSKISLKKGKKSIALTFSKLPLGDLLKDAFRITNGGGHALRIYDVTTINVDSITDTDIR